LIVTVQSFKTEAFLARELDDQLKFGKF